MPDPVDVVIVGAGPAGSVAALCLARAGVRVCLLEREALPRPKLCGDTLNPGAVETLASLGLTGGPLTAAIPLVGMLITSPTVAVRACYPGAARALAVARAPLDQWLAEAAVAAGAQLECGVRVREPIWIDDRRGRRVGGVVVSRSDGQASHVRAGVTIAADGRRSVLARAAKLCWHPPGTRRWAFGVYGADVDGMSEVGEMHVRGGHYVGLAPAAGGLANVCVVTSQQPVGRTPMDVIQRALDSDTRLRDRTPRWSAVSRPQVLGPLAVDCRQPGTAGLLLAGDAAGFIDPMTGDGTHLAIRGGCLAAEAALGALTSGDHEAAVTELTERRRRLLGAKLQFDRWLRRLVGSPFALNLASAGARVWPSALEHVVSRAGDVSRQRGAA